jgi:serine/threonine kinase 16
MAQIFLDILYSFGNCLNCFPGSPTLKINSRSFKILRLLGEASLFSLCVCPHTFD